MNSKANGKPDKRAILRMTLRQVFDKLYHKEELKGDGMHFVFALQRFEKLIGNPAVGKINDGMLERFRGDALKQYSPASVNQTRAAIRALLRRIGPQVTGNPRALGILSRVPYMRVCQVIREMPNRISQEDLSKWYIACNSMQVPRWGGGVPGYWWQTWIVVCYFTGLRKSDMFGLRWADLDLEAGTLLFTAQKTLKPARVHLHPRAVEHLRRIAMPGEYVFPGRLSVSGDFNRRWNSICEKAKVKFTPHDVRRTAGSEIERVKPGMAAVLLQHRFIDPTHLSYLNQVEELGECVDQMRIPVAFGQGVRQAERQLERSRRENEQMMRTARFAPPCFPDPSEWQFIEAAHTVGIRGKYIKAFGAAYAVIKAIATSPNRACDLDTLRKAVWPPDGVCKLSPECAQGRICHAISKLRVRLRHALCLPTEWNAIPCLERGFGGRWTIVLPADQAKDGAA